jgi:Uma2 family endonuclease
MADAPVANWTAADVERLSAQSWRVELWKGQLLRMAPTGDLRGRVTWRLVETASSTQSRQEMDGKAQQWLERGVPLVWVVWPARHQVDEWRQGDTSPRALDRGDALDGHEIVPGFHLPLADLFAVLFK